MHGFRRSARGCALFTIVGALSAACDGGGGDAGVDVPRVDARFDDPGRNVERTGLVAVARERVEDPDAGASDAGASDAGASLTFAATATAAFTEGPFASGNCSMVTRGPCIVRDCSPPQVGTDGGGPREPVARSAGVVSVTGGTGAAVTLTPDDMAFYLPVDLPAARWMAGDMLTVMAAGADVPAFSTQVTFPAAAQLTAPAITAGAPLAVVRTEDLRLAWTGAAGAEVRTRITQPVGEAGSAVVIECVFPGSAGMATIPSAALATLLTTMDGKSEATLRVETRVAREVTAGAWRVSVVASDEAARTALAVQ